MKEKTCCFTGHRHLPKNKIIKIKALLNIEIDALIRLGITNFISGGALGFDQLAAEIVANKKDNDKNINLIFALPCKNQNEKWTDTQKKHYNYLLQKVDKIIYVSENYTNDCMKKRNFYMVDLACVCLCLFTKIRSGTGQTVRYANLQELKIINIIKQYC